MDSKNTLSISEARKKIFEIADSLQLPESHFVLTEKGKPKAVMISADYFDSLLETIETLQDFPSLAEDIKQAEKDIKSGAYKQYAVLQGIMAKQGFVVADKGNAKYAVQPAGKAKRAKRA